MTSNTYREIKEELRYIADILDENNFCYKVYNRGVQFNIKDIEGVIHSFYPTTGTMLFHASNDRSDRRTKTIREGSLDRFLRMLKNPEQIKNYFK